jgi:hypothetical protein
MNLNSETHEDSRIVRTEDRELVHYIVYQTDQKRKDNSELTSLCAMAYKKYLDFYEAFSKQKHDEMHERLKTLADALQDIAAFYKVVIVSDAYARYTVNRTSTNDEPYILYLRDFAITTQMVDTFSVDKVETRVHLNVEWGEHAFLPALREELKQMDLVGVLNPAYLTTDRNLAFMLRGMFRDSSQENKAQEKFLSEVELQGNMFRFQDDTWFEGVRALVKSAHAIVMYVSNFSNGSTLEIDMIETLGRANDTLIFYGHKATKNDENSFPYVNSPDRLKNFAGVLLVKNVCKSEMQENGKLKLTFLEPAKEALSYLISSSKGRNPIDSESWEALFKKEAFIQDRPDIPADNIPPGKRIVFIPYSEQESFDSYLKLVDIVISVFDSFKARQNLEETIAKAFAYSGAVFVNAANFEDRTMMIKSIQCLLVAVDYCKLPTDITKSIEITVRMLFKIFNNPGPEPDTDS